MVERHTRNVNVMDSNSISSSSKSRDDGHSDLKFVVQIQCYSADTYLICE